MQSTSTGLRDRPSQTLSTPNSLVRFVTPRASGCRRRRLGRGDPYGTVADARFAKPIDAGLVAQLAAEHELLVTLEEGVLAGGFGSAVWETLSDAGMTPRILRVGLPDRYVTHGSPALLHEEVGFTGKRIAERIEAAIAEREGVAG